MPGMDGLELLRRLHAKRPALPVILITAHGSVPSAVAAMREGAFDYLTKPFDNDELRALVGRALDLTRLERENRYLKQEVASRYAPDAMVAESARGKELLDLVRRVAPSKATVLIQGESGTGKELVARLLHYWSDRVGQPFVAVNCKAFAEGVLESELFGHEKGAFTGAATTRAGCFERAQGGTLFLDEIGEMSLDFQAKLLRVLQEGEVLRVGGTQPRKVDVRVVAATNRVLRDEVQGGRFREDLFFRLNVIPVQLAPLRERREDVLPLAHHFLARHAAGGGRRLALSPEAERALAEHAWPGNVRELENVIERAVVLARGEVDHAGGPAARADARTERGAHAGRELRHAAGVPRPRRRGADPRGARGGAGAARRGGARARHRAHHALPDDEAARHGVGSGDEGTARPRLRRSLGHHARGSRAARAGRGRGAGARRGGRRRPVGRMDPRRQERPAAAAAADPRLGPVGQRRRARPGRDRLHAGRRGLRRHQRALHRSLCRAGGRVGAADRDEAAPAEPRRGGVATGDRGDRLADAVRPRARRGGPEGAGARRRRQRRRLRRAARARGGRARDRDRERAATSEAVRALGADEVVDRGARFEDLLAPVDVVLDTVGGAAQERSFAVLKRGGALISAVSEPDAKLAERHGVRAAFMLVDVETPYLDEIAARLDAGTLVARVGAVLPLADARTAHEMLEGTRPRPRGKIVLRVA